MEQLQIKLSNQQYSAYWCEQLVAICYYYPNFITIHPRDKRIGYKVVQIKNTAEETARSYIKKGILWNN